MGSKNGTLVNGQKIACPTPLKAGDQILAGHLTMVFDAPSRKFERTVVVFDGREERTRSATYATDLTHAITSDRPVAASRMEALIKAGQGVGGTPSVGRAIHTHPRPGSRFGKGRTRRFADYRRRLARTPSRTGREFSHQQWCSRPRVERKESILVNDVQSNEAFRAMHSLVQQQVRMLMAAPLQTKDDVIGLIYVDSPSLFREFTADDLSMLTVLANVAAIRIEHARLIEVEQAKVVLAKDLEQAAQIQQALLPSQAPKVPGVALAGHNAACRTVGGDYYDFIPYPDGKVAIALGDVSGKAMPAALLMTNLHARVRVLAEDPPHVAEMMMRLNRATAANCPSNRFVSFFFSVFDPGERSSDLCECRA